jgi:cytochrome c5
MDGMSAPSRLVIIVLCAAGFTAASLTLGASTPESGSPFRVVSSHGSQSTEPTAEALEKGKELAERVCTTCHELGPEMTAGRSAEAWKKVIEEMKLMGAQASDEEFAIITEYLIHAYPAKQPAR